MFRCKSKIEHNTTSLYNNNCEFEHPVLQRKNIFFHLFEADTQWCQLQMYEKCQQDAEGICIVIRPHRCEGESCSSQPNVLTSAEISPSHRTQRCSGLCIFSYDLLELNGKIKLSNEAYWRECEMGLSHHMYRGESHQHECKNGGLTDKALNYII